MESANKRTHSYIGTRNCRVPSQYVRSAEGYSAAAEPCWRMEKPWTLSKPARGTLPLNPFQKTPPTPSIFEGAPSPVGRSKQSFDNAKRVWGLVWLSIYFCSLSVFKEMLEDGNCYPFYFGSAGHWREKATCDGCQYIFVVAERGRFSRVRIMLTDPP